ncbi:MAG: flagellar basal body L-ring protein FlgH [Bryobacteraceae bacterium]
MKLTIALLVPLALVAKSKKPEPSPLDRYIEEAVSQPAVVRAGPLTAGSLWNPAAPLGDLARDLRASQPDDLVTILVSERASATATGNTKTARNSSMSGNVPSVFGPTPARLKDMLSLGGNSQLDGQGTTSRETTLTTTLTARVTNVLPNGYLVVEGTKDTHVNSERQLVTVRGVVRPADLNPGNLVRSDRLANLEVRINGKGVVGDAIKRPFFLFRLLAGLLP